MRRMNAAHRQDLSDAPLVAGDVARGVCRLLFHQDLMSMCEVPLGNGRRADVVALGPDGGVTLVEIKVYIADLRGDVKWTEYREDCDGYLWAVPAGFRIGDLEQDCFRPPAPASSSPIAMAQPHTAKQRSARW